MLFDGLSFKKEQFVVKSKLEIIDALDNECFKKEQFVVKSKRYDKNIF